MDKVFVRNISGLINTKNGGYKWVILVFLAFIHIVVMMQFMGRAVLFPVIRRERHFSIDQLGFIWGMWNFGGVFLYILGGLIGDRIGIRTSIFISPLIVAMCGEAMGED